jgi:RHS repeat-associated protein
VAREAAATQYTYDAAGDVTYDGTNSYLYDAEGRLCAVKNSAGAMTGYIYDAAGTRVARGSLNTFSCNFSSNGYATTTSWVLDLAGEQVTEYSVSSGWVHSNAFEGGKLLATYEGANTYFAFNDWLGTKRVELAADLTCGTAFTSLPYGNGLNPAVLPGFSACPDATEHHFTGKERDAESGNDYFFARYYSSAIGRFMSPDWSAKAQPVPYAKLDDPQTLNLYGYLRNNPVGGVDADGHCGGGPNDPPCGEVKVKSEPNLPEVEKNHEYRDKNGNVVARGTGIMAKIVVTVTDKSGKALDHVKVDEQNSQTVTRDGKDQNAPPPYQGKAETNENGQFQDSIRMQKRTDGSAQANGAILGDFGGHAWRQTDAQTLTFTFPGGETCLATSTRTLTNSGADSGILSNYGLTTTQPQVTAPPH